jgi:hypothetical protein
MNLYGFVANNPLSKVDVLGQWGRTVHFGRTLGWSVGAGFNSEFANIIANADQNVDVNLLTGVVVGQLSRHMNRPSDVPGGGDSRDYWFKHESEEATEALNQSDKDHRTYHCYTAANDFGMGLHSLQDTFAHRPWPDGPDWPRVWPGTLIPCVHPPWWDDWYGELNSGYHSNESEIKWAEYFSQNPQDDTYMLWINSPSQASSQNEARRKAGDDSIGAIGLFASEVAKHCVCARLMLDNP